MSTETREHSRQHEDAGADNEEDSGGNLAAHRSDIDRIFAVASRTFERISSGDSQEFLESSRQTGGQ